MSNTSVIPLLRRDADYGDVGAVHASPNFQVEAWKLAQLSGLRGKVRMTTSRIFSSSDFFQPTDDEPIRSVVTETKDAVIVAWYIKQGQKIPLHIHPQGQDTWTLLAGKGHYYLDNNGTTIPIMAGDVIVAHTGEVHGVFNDNPEPLVFISVVSPADAGYQSI